jgi:ribosome-associated protein
MASDDLGVRRDLVIPARELLETASRASGPGGQHVNKTSTRVTLRWNVRDSEALSPTQRARLLQRLAARLTREGELVMHAAESRSQSQNRTAARARLAECVRQALRRPRPRVPTRPGRGAVERRISEKKRQSTRKQQRRRPRLEE